MFAEFRGKISTLLVRHNNSTRAIPDDETDEFIADRSPGFVDHI